MSTCEHEGCGYPAVAAVNDATLPYPHGTGLGFAIVRPITSPARVGRFLCCDHTVGAVLDVLMSAMPGPGGAS